MTDFADSSGTICLANPVSHHFPTFIFGNSTKCDHVVTEGSHTGKHVVICGAGPSLRDHAAEHCVDGVDVWGCNSALTWLADHGHHVTHGFTVDQTPEMVNEWASVPDVEYLLASTVHPFLTDLVQGAGRFTRFFHNYVGIDMPPVAYDGHIASYEDWMYSALFLPTVRVGSGLNAVTRAIDLAEYMGYETITVLGADCALRVRKPQPKHAAIGSPAHIKWLTKHTEMHADGGHALASGATAVTLTGEIDGRSWVTKPDMMISAVFMVRMMRRLGDRLRVIGDTLPAALKDKPDAYLDRLPSLTDHTGQPIRLG